MNKLFLFILLLLPGSSFCQTHENLASYNDLFLAEAKARGLVFRVQPPQSFIFFENGHKDIHAGCFFEEKTIFVNKEWWDLANDEEREIVMFHELAHWYFKAGEIRHYGNAIMNPNHNITNYTKGRTFYVDNMFRRAKLIESTIDRHDLSLRAGSIIITSPSPESEQFNVYVLKDDTPENLAASKVIIDSVLNHYRQYDYINSKGWRCMPFKHHGIEPSLELNTPVSEVWGEMNRIYMFSEDQNTAPLLGLNARGIWKENTEMKLVIDYKTEVVPVNRNVTVMYYVKRIPTVDEAKKFINIK